MKPPSDPMIINPKELFNVELWGNIAALEISDHCV